MQFCLNWARSRARRRRNFGGTRRFSSAFGAAFVSCACAEALAASAVWCAVLARLEPAALEVVRGLDDCPARFAEVLRLHRVLEPSGRALVQPLLLAFERRTAPAFAPTFERTASKTALVSSSSAQVPIKRRTHFLAEVLIECATGRDM